MPIILVIIRIIRVIRARVQVCGPTAGTVPGIILRTIISIIVGQGEPIIDIRITMASLVIVCGYIPKIRGQVFLGVEVLLMGNI